MVRKEAQPTALPGVFSTLAAGFELTTRYLWLMVLPALLDLFLWIGPRLSFRTLIESFIAQLPVEAIAADAIELLESTAAQINHFTYLSVSLLGLPTLMAGPMPEKTPVAPTVLDGGGWAAWLGLLLLFTVVGLLLAALYYNLIAYAMRRAQASPLPLSPVRFLRRVIHTWLRLVALAVVIIVLIGAILLPTAFLAGFLALISMNLATLAILAGLMVAIWLMMFLSLTPQGMLLNPRGFVSALAESVRLFQSNLPSAVGILFVVVAGRQLLGAILLSADSGTWVTAINILAHAYIATALTVALFLYYRDRYVAYLKSVEPASANESAK